MYLGVWARNDPHARVSTCSASTSTPTTPLHVPPNCQTRARLGFGFADKGRTRRTGRSFDRYQSAPGSLKQSAGKPRPIIRITRFLTPVHKREAAQSD